MACATAHAPPPWIVYLHISLGMIRRGAHNSRAVCKYYFNPPLSTSSLEDKRPRHDLDGGLEFPPGRCLTAPEPPGDQLLACITSGYSVYQYASHSWHAHKQLLLCLYQLQYAKWQAGGNSYKQGWS